MEKRLTQWKIFCWQILKVKKFGGGGGDGYGVGGDGGSAAADDDVRNDSSVDDGNEDSSNEEANEYLWRLNVSRVQHVHASHSQLIPMLLMPRCKSHWGWAAFTPRRWTPRGLMAGRLGGLFQLMVLIERFITPKTVRQLLKVICNHALHWPTCQALLAANKIRVMASF